MLHEYSSQVRRALSSSAVRRGAEAQMVKAPIPLFGIAGDYAGALYSAAVKASF